ncbi:hypothetical protein BU15DRAFT_76562 [Melanogaster broomeanus]|nr:hypothetical protein BU15DRAFT_76562 [Melanogaster broomeanus]
MDVRPYILFRRLLQLLFALTKRTCSVIVRLWPIVLTNDAQSQVINPSNCAHPLLPIHASSSDVWGASRPQSRTGSSTQHSATQNDDNLLQVPPSGNAASGGAPAVDSDKGDVKVKTICVDGVKRYKRNIRLPPKGMIGSIPANTTTFEENVPDHLSASGWTRLVHPEGALYFQHKDGIYTDADIRDPEMFDKINRAIKSIKNAGPPIQTDSFTPATSLSPFDKEELSKMLDLSSHIQESLETIPEVPPHAKVLVARILRTFARARFFNFHGEVGARLDADQTVYNIMERRHSILHHLISWILFLAPNVHMKTLKTIWVDQTVNYVPWKQFLEKLNNEWQELVLYATVILNANVAFLSIPMVNGSNDTPPETSAEICSYISVATSLGAVATGLLLMRQNRTKRRETAEDAATFMMKMDCSMFGMETIAILFSLPYGMLMWRFISCFDLFVDTPVLTENTNSLLSFVCGFCILMFMSTNVTTRVLVGFVGVLVIIFTGWTISYAYGADEASRSHDKPHKPKHSGTHCSNRHSVNNGVSPTASAVLLIPQLQVPTGGTSPSSSSMA